MPVPDASNLVEGAAANLRDQLLELGVSARLAPGGPPLRPLRSPIYGQEADCTLDVLEGPIRWINVAVWVPLGAASDEPRHAYYVRHGIPDTRLADLPRTVDVSLTPLRGFPIIGRVTGMTWRGKDGGSGLLRHLNADLALREVVFKEWGSRITSPLGQNPMWISARHEQPFWLLSTPYPTYFVYPGPTPQGLTKTLWDSYQAVAVRLLEFPLPP